MHSGDFKGSDINLSECNMNGNKYMGNEMRFKQFQQDLTVLIKLSLNCFLNKHKSSWRANAFVKNKKKFWYFWISYSVSMQIVFYSTVAAKQSP